MKCITERMEKNHNKKLYALSVDASLLLMVFDNVVTPLYPLHLDVYTHILDEYTKKRWE